MKKISIITAAVLVLLGFFYAFTNSTDVAWSLDNDHARLGFTVSHMTVTDVDGCFRNFDAQITADREDFSDAVVTMTAQVNSIDTDNEKRDNELKGPYYFNAAKYPTISFKSRSFTKIDAENYKMVGDLTMHGVTKTVELNARSRMANNPKNMQDVAGFKVTGTIRRLDFGVGLSATAAMVGNDVDITANVEFGKSQLP
jgi:polyisoprenoid-binding protein YceI